MRFGPVAISDMELHYRSVVPCHYMEYPVTSGLNGTCQWGSSAHERLGMEVPLCRTAFNLKLVPIILRNLLIHIMILSAMVTDRAWLARSLISPGRAMAAGNTTT